MKQTFDRLQGSEDCRGFCASLQVCFQIFALNMASASTSHAEGEQEWIFSS